MIKSVVREHHWPPAVVNTMYLDAVDHEGLIYWYDDVCAVAKEVNEKKPKK